jgi:hypothetical protein
MENTELLMHLAEIAGVFVGFGALISVRSEAIRDEEVMMIRQIVIFGITVIVAGLLPVVIASFGVKGHGLWATSAGVFLILWWGSSILNQWDLERTRVLAAIKGRARMRMEAPSVPLWLCMNAALVLILTGRLSEWEPALYLAAVVLNLLLTAGMLVYLVYLQRSSYPASVRDAAAQIEANSSARVPETKPIAKN